MYVHPVILASLVKYQFVMGSQETTHDHVMVMVGVSEQINVTVLVVVMLVISVN